MKNDRTWLGKRAVGGIALATGLLLAATGMTVHADGSETLGPPSIPIASGTDVDVAGTGLWTQPGMITVDIPAANTVEQVLVYWEGHQSSATTGGDDTLVLGGTTVTGQLIGGPTRFFGNNWSATYRADVTGLGLVGPGTNTLSVSGLNFDRVNNGAGLLVISDDGTSPHDISLRDGNDLAYIGFAPPLDTTALQTFTFEPAPVERSVELKIFASSVEGPDYPGERPNVIEVVVDGVATRYQHLLGSYDGDEWDAVELEIAVPAGVGEVTVQALSADDDATGNRPASLAWLAAAAVVPPYVPPTTTTTTVPETTTTTTTVPETTTTTTTTSTTTTTTTTSTTTTTTVPETSTTTTPEPTLDINALRPVCIDDAPFIEYSIELTNIEASTATLELRDVNGELVDILDDMPLAGEILWPGASVDPPDWPGWDLVNGVWVPDQTDAILRDGIFVTARVNPEATAEVSYPPATEACNGPEISTPTTTIVDSGSATTVTLAPELPATGSDSTRAMVLVGVGLMLFGLTLLLGSRRPKTI